MANEHDCEHCKWRQKAEAAPTSLLARLWRWHTRWCPGWKRYQRTLARGVTTGTILALAILAACQTARTGTVASGLDAITDDALMADVAALAAPEYSGRLAGSAGYEAAARWAARRFGRLGLEPAGTDDGFLQYLTIEYNAIEGQPRLSYRVAGRRVDAILGDDFTCRGFTGSGRLNHVPVVFAGYGLSAPERGYDDYAGLDVVGKVVLVFKRNPSWSPDSLGWDWASSTPRAKANWARDHGAVGMLWFDLPRDEGIPVRGPIGSVLHGPGEHPTDVPQLELNHLVADRLLGADGEARRLKALIDSTRTPHSGALAARVSLDVQASYDPARQTCNVVARLPGRDPMLADEALVIGAHLDHVGRQSPDVYFPGANDNASGAAAVLRLAEAFSRAPQAPRRSVVFVLFAGEESGLIGARHHAANPVVPAERTVAMFNLDCVACGDSIKVGGGQSNPEHWQLARDLDRAGAQLMVDATWKGGGADASPFFDAGIPTLYWVTTNSYTYLHRPEDTPETLNADLYAELVKLAFRTAWAVADAPADSVVAVR